MVKVEETLQRREDYTAKYPEKRLPSCTAFGRLITNFRESETVLFVQTKKIDLVCKLMKQQKLLF